MICQAPVDVMLLDARRSDKISELKKLNCRRNCEATLFLSAEKIGLWLTLVADEKGVLAVN